MIGGEFRRIRDGLITDVLQAVLRQLFHYCDEYYRIMSISLHQLPGIRGGGRHGV